MPPQKDGRPHFLEKDHSKGARHNGAPQQGKRMCIDCGASIRGSDAYKVRCVPCWQTWRDHVEANEVRASEHAAPLPSPEQVAARSETGRKWMAFWYAEGIRPKPTSITWEQVDEMFGDARLEDMRAEVERARKGMVR